MPTLDARYDKYEVGCYAFFKYYDFNRIAKAMNESTKLPGPDLCSWAKESYSMAPSLTGKTVECARATTTVSSPDQTPGGGGARGLLTAFDHVVLVSLFARQFTRVQ